LAIGLARHGRHETRDLVEVLNRRGGPLVLPPSEALADMPIAGRFRLDDPRQLLNAIGAAYGFSVKRRGR
jgi:transmembrane sensor